MSPPNPASLARPKPGSGRYRRLSAGTERTESPFAAQARARKVASVVRTVTALCAQTGARDVPAWLQSLTERQWRELAVVSGVRPLSATSMDAVVQAFAGREVAL